MLQFIDTPISKVLEIRCGRGSYLNLHKGKFPDAESWGLEFDFESGKIAESFRHKILMGNAEEIIDPVPDIF
jgi:hypothetical protein